MDVFEGYSGMYHFQALPRFATYIREQRLRDYVTETIRLSRRMQLPLLQFFRDWPEEKLLQYFQTTASEFLSFLAANQGKKQIREAIALWQKDQLEIVGKYEITAQDLTLVVYIRSRALKGFIRDYTTDMATAMQLVEELDTFNLGEITTATGTYMGILKDKINQEVHFNNRLANTTPGMIYVFDLKEHKTVYFNRNAGHILGFSHEAVQHMGTRFLEALTHPDDMAKVEEHLKCFDTMKDEEICSFEHRMRDAEGAYRWIRHYETVFKRNEAGEPVQVIGAAYDISEEKKIEEHLEWREMQLLEAQSIAQIGSFEWDLIREETNNTEQFYKIFGIEKGCKFDQFMRHIHPEDQAKVMAAFDNSMKTGHLECEYRYLMNGQEKYIWSKGRVLFTNGRPHRVFGTIQDITERRKIEQALLQKTVELEKTNTDLREFTYVASHDLKEPLRKISTYADMILTKEKAHLSDATQSHFNKILDASKRMQKLIDDILSLSSVATHTQKEVFSLQAALDEVLLLLEHLIQQKEATITSDGLPDAYISPPLFRQLFLNLISNALKFSKPGIAPHISITHSYLDAKKIMTAHAEGASYLAIRVEDNGIGFSNEFSEKIFTLFQRLHSQKEYEGSGLGLAICKRIVEEHGGIIYANSTPGFGTVFTIIIPFSTR